jgi:glycosyltransferase involved in cell wall biosynthesis
VLRVATVIPSFRRGSGGHATVVNLLRELQARGHSTSIWLEDHESRHAQEPATLTKRSFADFFAADGLELHTDFGEWSGADVVLATGWQTVARTLMLSGASARAYLVQDHEPDFYAASAEALWAAQSYRSGLHCIAASRWLADLLSTRYGARSGHFDLAVDHAIYRTAGVERRPDVVVFYARAVTPRRAVPLGLLALAELARRRPELEIVIYGEDRPLAVPFAHRNVGVLEAQGLARLYSEATVGMVLSLTNPSLINLEMMACGLPCVELASESMLATFGAEGPIELAGPDPRSLCERIERLLEDPRRRQDASRRGKDMVAERTWERAAQQLESGLRGALKDTSGL